MRPSFALPAAMLAVLGILPAAPARGLTADELVAKNLEARGGAARLDAIHSLRLSGKFTFGSGSSQVEAEWAALIRRPDGMRDELTMQGLTMVSAWDGRDAWSLNPFRGRRDAQKDSADDARRRAQDAELDGPLLHWRDKGHSVEYLGTEDVDGSAAYKLRVDRKDGDTQILYLDPDYFLEIRIETVSHVRGTEETTVADLGSYRRVAGVWFPFAIDVGAKGSPPSARLADRARDGQCGGRRRPLPPAAGGDSGGAGDPPRGERSIRRHRGRPAAAGRRSPGPRRRRPLRSRGPATSARRR